MRHVYLITLFACVLFVSILGLRGTKFVKPPLDQWPEWAFPSMEHQPKPRPQSESRFFADGRNDRVPPARTIARGMLRDDDHLHAGKDAAGEFARGFPAQLNLDLGLLERGRDRYTVFCAPCHGTLGDGQGITVKYGMGTVAANGNYHTDRLRAMPEGELYHVIAAGRNTMLPYADKLTPDERWAVVAYVRALQRARQGRVADVADAAGRQILGIQ
jgi:mono/diheme cytochrome c family protein